MTFVDADAPELSIETPRLVGVRATAENVGEIQACLDAAPAYFARSGGVAADEALRLVADAEADSQRRVLALVRRTGGPAIGVLDLHLDYPEPLSAQIGLLLFAEAWQGRGYGTETTAALEQALVRLGYRALRLSVVDDNVEAALFWERRGFPPVSRVEGGATLYEKPLR